MITKYFVDRSDEIQRLAIWGGRVLLGLGLGIVMSTVGLAIAWGLFVFSSSGSLNAFMVMNMVGSGIGASIGANIAWVKMDRQRRTTLLFLFLVCAAGGIVGGLLGYQWGANREIDCCAEPRTTPFLYAAIGGTIGANVVMYLATLASSVVRAARRGKRPVPHRP